MNRCTRTPAPGVRRAAARPVASLAAVAALLLGGCSGGEATPGEAQDACAGQLERAGITDIDWSSTEKSDKGYVLAGRGAEGDLSVEVECQTDLDGAVRRSTSGSPG